MWSRYFSSYGLKIGLATVAAATPAIVHREDEWFNVGNNIQCSNYVHPGAEIAVDKCRKLVQQFKELNGAPGVSIGVSIHGHLVWKEGFGFADVENLKACNGDTVMRIASISKPVAMTLVAKAWEEGKLDIDAPVQKYVPDFPQKEFDGKKVTITSRHLVSHLSGIRHYSRRPQDYNIAVDEVREPCTKCEQPLPAKKYKREFAQNEYFNKKQYATTKEALDMFKNDPLISAPGTKFVYTSHGWTLMSAVLESAVGERFDKQLRSMFHQMGMKNTHLDQNNPLISNRARYYRRRVFHRLENVPFVNNSYKWAGGGILSNVADLLRFSNILLYSYQCVNQTTAALLQMSQDAVNDADKPQLPLVNCRNSDGSRDQDNLLMSAFAQGLCCPQPGYLNSETVHRMWTPVVNTILSCAPEDGVYGMGWGVMPPVLGKWGPERPGYVLHTGGAVGATSILLIAPMDENEAKEHCPPRGISVAVLANLQECYNIHGLAIEIANIFKIYSMNSNTCM